MTPLNLYKVLVLHVLSIGATDEIDLTATAY